MTYALRMYVLLLAMKNKTRKWCHTMNLELSLCVWNRLRLFPVQKFPNSESRAERQYVFEMDCDLIKSKERLNQMAAGPAADDELWTKRGQTKRNNFQAFINLNSKTQRQITKKLNSAEITGQLIIHRKVKYHFLHYK